MLEFVEQILDSQDNIIDQLKLLSANKKNKEVKKYMKSLLSDRKSPYFNYCIDKYYFNKDIDEVKPPIPKLSIYWFGNRDKITKLIESKDNIIDQLKILKKHKDDKDIDEYINNYLECNISKYERYCIQKYYYEMDVKEVLPTAKNLNITLYRISFKDIEEKVEKNERKKFKKALNKAKKGDKVKILEGPFKDEIGILNSYDIDNMKIFVTLCLFGQNIDIEHAGKFEIIKEKKDNK